MLRKGSREQCHACTEELLIQQATNRAGNTIGSHHAGSGIGHGGINSSGSFNHTSFPGKFSNNGGQSNGTGRGNNLRLDRAAKRLLKCEYCKNNGHTRENCFKLNGYPDWWPGNKGHSENHKGSGRNSAHMVDTPFDAEAGIHNGDLFSVITNLQNLQQKVNKLVKGKMPANEGEHINFAHFSDFAGPSD